MSATPAATASRDLVLSALRHQTPSRLPVDFGSTPVSGIHVSCVAALRDHFGLEKRPVKVYEPFQMLGTIDEDLMQALGVDCQPVNGRKTMFGFPNRDWKEWDFNGLTVLVGENFRTTTDAKGDIYIYPQGDLSAPPSAKMPRGFHFFDAIIRQNHFDENNLNPEDNLEEFGEISDEDIASFHADAVAARASGRCVVANLGGTALGDIALVPAPNLKDPRGVRDVAEWYMTTASRRDYVHYIFEHQTEIALRNLERLNAALGDLIDVVFVCGTDFGTQSSSFCSAPAFRELWLPYYKRTCSWIHAHTPWFTFKHSCGSVERFYESFIDAGFDIVNPVQCSAKGMDPTFLKHKYGGRLTFWGGGVDTQKTLPFGTPAEVRAQVLERAEIFAPDGGFVFNTIHNVQAGTPVENIIAMLDAIGEFNGQ